MYGYYIYLKFKLNNESLVTKASAEVGYARVVQLVKARICNTLIVGSNPTAGFEIYKKLLYNIYTIKKKRKKAMTIAAIEKRR